MRKLLLTAVSSIGIGIVTTVGAYAVPVDAPAIQESVNKNPLVSKADYYPYHHHYTYYHRHYYYHHYYWYPHRYYPHWHCWWGAYGRRCRWW